MVSFLVCFLNLVFVHERFKLEFANPAKIFQNAEEDMDGEDETEISTDGNVPTKKKKKKKKTSAADLKPPTAEEMIRLRETENLFHSNLFRMQIEEMIKEVKPKKMERKQIKPWIESLQELFLNLADSEELEVGFCAQNERTDAVFVLLTHRKDTIRTK